MNNCQPIVLWSKKYKEDTVSAQSFFGSHLFLDLIWCAWMVMTFTSVPPLAQKQRSCFMFHVPPSISEIKRLASLLDFLEHNQYRDQFVNILNKTPSIEHTRIHRGHICCCHNNCSSPWYFHYGSLNQGPKWTWNRNMQGDIKAITLVFGAPKELEQAQFHSAYWFRRVQRNWRSIESFLKDEGTRVFIGPQIGPQKSIRTNITITD